MMRVRTPSLIYYSLFILISLRSLADFPPYVLLSPPSHWVSHRLGI